jgi:hypothetical protein
MTLAKRPYLAAAGTAATAIALCAFWLLGYPYVAEYSLITGAATVLFAWALLSLWS